MKKMTKRTILVFVINIMAFGSTMASIYSEFGLQFFIKLIVPLTVMFATNLSAAMLSFRTGDDSKPLK